ncbi:MAG: rubredoxin [Muribaculaceae bacterium]|nr:rubredoxin [Muribaculaceae bacterium]
MKKYICNVCGYIYDPAVGSEEQDIKPGTSFESLPDTYVCPICEAPKSEFSPVE